MWPASKRVNSSRADGDDATLIEQEVLKRSGSVVPERMSNCTLLPLVHPKLVECFAATGRGFEQSDLCEAKAIA